MNNYFFIVIYLLQRFYSWVTIISLKYDLLYFYFVNNTKFNNNKLKIKTIKL